MADRIQAIRGMNDILPEKTPLWRYIEKITTQCLSNYGYQEIRFPIVESTQLFKRTIGEVTDIVEKEMYSFTDLNGESISLRPEGTACCVRACLEHGLLHNQQQKLWYIGPMFRHEKPQKGRYRQFSQLGVEVFGVPGVAIELELIAVTYRMWEQLGLAGSVKLEINSLGEIQERHQYRERLIQYFKSHFDLLDADSKSRLERNPLRILDSKNPEMQELIKNAPKLVDELSDASRLHFQNFCAGLTALKIPFEINPVLVRGLDYYGHTVFEWVTEHLGSQSTICAGGRYDILVEQLGGSPTSAVGFAIGLDRLVILMEALNLNNITDDAQSVFIIPGNQESVLECLLIAESIRRDLPHLRVITNTAAGGFKSQFKKADKSGARLALILGEDEIRQNSIGVKDLRKESDQLTIELSGLTQFLKEYLV